MAASAKQSSKVSESEQETKKPARRACCRKTAASADKDAKPATKEVKATKATAKSAKSATAAKSAPAAKAAPSKAATTSKSAATKTTAAKASTAKSAIKASTAKATSTKATASTAKAAATKTVAKKDAAAATKVAAKKASASTTAKKTTAAKASSAKASAKAGEESKPTIKGTMVGTAKINRKMLAPVDSKREIVRKAEPSKGVEPEFADITLLNKQERFEVMRLLEEQNPNPKSELNFNNPFELLCAVVLSAQATDASVNKATPDLFKAAPDAKSMAALGADGIAPYIQSIGLWKNKAKFLANLAKTLDEKYDGKVPDNMEELIALPGVGSKTAKVVLNVAFGKPYLAVDTHVFRVSTRLGLCLGHCPGDVENKIPPLIDERFMKEAHHYLLLHGRYNCTARKFEDHCAKCVVAKYCKHNY